MHTRTREDGFAMVAVMGAIALITVLAVGGFYISSEVLNESERVLDDTRAFQVAQSGLDYELAIFTPNNIDTGYFPRSGSTDDGTYVVDVQSLGGSGFEYVMTSEGTVAGTSETVTMRFYYLNLWDMNIGSGDQAALGGGRGWNGNATVTGPLYVRGQLDWTSNAAYEGGPLFVRDGVLNVSGSGELGKSNPIKLYSTGGITGFTNQVYLDGPMSSSVPDIELPWISDDDMERYYQLSLKESKDNNMGSTSRSIVSTEVTGGDPTTYATALGVPRVECPSAPAASSTHYKYIGPVAGPSASGSGGTFVEIGYNRFGAWAGSGYPAASAVHDDFAFDPVTGTLYVEGTVFIDGPLHIAPTVTNYVGNGTLVVNGDVFIGAKLRPRDGLSGEQSLGIVTPGDVRIGDNPYSGNIQAHFTGAIFSNGEVSLYHTQTSYDGSILAGNIYGDKPDIHLTTNPILPTVLPESMPAAGGGMVFSGVWTRR